MKNSILFLGFISLALFSSCGEGEKVTPPRDLSEDVTIIQNYIAENNISGVESTGSGLYYKIESNGYGIQAAAGKTVSVDYTGKLLDGTVFDSSIGRGSFTFVLGQGQVIAGWDEGIALFRRGGNGTLYIPSQLAYGSRGQGSITPNSVLIFDITVVNVQ